MTYNNKKTRKLSINLSVQEDESIDHIADSLGISKADAVRRAASFCQLVIGLAPKGQKYVTIDDKFYPFP